MKYFVEFGFYYNLYGSYKGRKFSEIYFYFYLVNFLFI